MTIVIIACGIFLLFYCSLLIYYRIGWKGLQLFNSTSQGDISITVVIAARNEEQTLPVLLRSLQQQSYPQTLFEVIVVDDHSTDNTAQAARHFAGIKIISLADHVHEPINSYKKKAIETGISLAKGELIVTTDADCIAHPHWLRDISAFHKTNQSAFIVMPVRMLSGNTFIEKFQALDFMSLQGITGSAVQLQLHVMCNGANIAYTKQAYNEVKGFTGIDNIASGDDMLLMSKIIAKYPDKVHYLKSPYVIIDTMPMKTVKEFINQRIRWASKSGSYTEPQLKGILLLIYLLNVLLLVIPILNIFLDEMPDNMSPWLIWLLFVLIKAIAELFFLWDVAGFFRNLKLLSWFLLFQPLHILYTVIAGTLGLSGTYTWKDRKVK